MAEIEDVIDAEVVVYDDEPESEGGYKGSLHPVAVNDRGRGYLINHINGGQSELAAKDDVEFTNEGILVRHNDPGKSFTFYPWFNIVWIREHGQFTK